jgi:hypothetical protein
VFLEDLFKGDSQGTGEEPGGSCAILWKLLLALSGPTNNILLVKDSVKDRGVHNCGYLVLYTFA